MGDEDALVFTTGYQANVGAHRDAARPDRHRDLRLRRPRLDHGRRGDVARQGAAVPPQPARQARVDARRARPATAAACWWWSTASSRWRATSATCRASPSCARAHGARLMVDEAHGVGVLGAAAPGACEALGVEDQVDLRMGTFSKSLASCGGFIAGPAEVIDFLRIQSRAFMFTAVGGAGRGRRRARRAADHPLAPRGRSCSRGCSTTRATCERGLRRARLRGRSADAAATARARHADRAGR